MNLKVDTIHKVFGILLHQSLGGHRFGYFTTLRESCEMKDVLKHHILSHSMNKFLACNEPSHGITSTSSLFAVNANVCRSHP